MQAAPTTAPQLAVGDQLPQLVVGEITKEQIAEYSRERRSSPAPAMYPLVLGVRWERPELHRRIETRLRERSVIAPTVAPVILNNAPGKFPSGKYLVLM